MSKLQHDKQHQNIKFKCPGCGDIHILNLNNNRSPCWTWNGSESKPTIKPSINYSLKNKNGDIVIRCHSFVEGGYIRFLSDCTHDMKGQEVELSEIA